MRFLVALLAFTCVLAGVLSQSEDTTTDSAITTESSTTSETTTVTTPETTPETTPTTLPTTPSTLPTTSSPEPSPTTATPETTSQTSSTAAPTPVPTTTGAPVTTAFPEPEKCSWNITRNGVTCIRAELQAQFIIPNNQGKISYINIGCDAVTAGSDCSLNDTQTLNLVETRRYNLAIIFEKVDNKVSVRNITLDYTLSDGESGSVESKGELFTVTAGNSYLCRSKSDVKLDNVTMEISDIHIYAFGAKDNENYGADEECKADDKVSDVVPIAVGVALATLIIIVLVAYLIGRRRSRQRGYQSV